MNTLVTKFQEYSAWRANLKQAVDGLCGWMKDAQLTDALAESRISRVQSHIADDKLTVAFVAEFSRGKSELINSIFFSEYGQRILPSSAGRTTMCPTELLYDAGRPPEIRLLPIETRASHLPLTEYKTRPQDWQVIPLDTESADGMLAAIAEVCKVKRIAHEDARNYGLYDDADPDQVASLDREGKVEVSMWRHAVINFPHPLLRQGLVILDTPGLNAIGSEPELTLSMIPNAHAVVFLLAADTGVTKSDIEVWRNHISGARKHGRLVVLNKIDSMWDELKSATQVEADITRQVASCAQMLAIDARQIFPVSAQKALLAKVQRDEVLLKKSRIAELERALTARLIPQKLEIVRDIVHGELQELLRASEVTLTARVASSEQQLAELGALKGKNASVIAHMLARVKAEKEEFDKSLLSFQALRAVHARLSSEVFEELGLKAVRERARHIREQMMASAFSSGMRESMAGYFRSSRTAIEQAQEKLDEVMRLMLAMAQKFGAEHGMRVVIPAKLTLDRYIDEIDRVERIYAERFGLFTILTTEKVVLTQKFFESIASELKGMFEVANRDVEAWLKAVMAPLEGQIREHQVQLKKRSEAIRQVQGAAELLDERLAEVAAQDRNQRDCLARLAGLNQSIEAALEIHEDADQAMLAA